MSLIEEQKKARENEKTLFNKVDKSQDLFNEGKITFDQMLKVEAEWRQSIDELREINSKIEKGTEEIAQDQIERQTLVEEPDPEVANKENNKDELKEDR
jgi:seryl-tRNA synthetase